MVDLFIEVGLNWTGHMSFLTGHWTGPYAQICRTGPAGPDWIRTYTFKHSSYQVRVINSHKIRSLDTNLVSNKFKVLQYIFVLNVVFESKYSEFTDHRTLVGLSTRPSPLIISKYLQFRNFWSQSKALFMVRCILSVGSGSNTFGALKVTIYVKFFELSVHKMSTFLRISAWQWAMPSGLFAKKSHPNFFCSC